MQNRALEMEVFVTIVDAGSFSAAARAFSMSPSAISKLVTRLEKRLGVQLVVRSTRSFRLTSEGADFYETSRGIVQEIAEAEAKIARKAEAVGGLLKVSTNMPFGMHVLSPLVVRFLDDNPGMRIDLEFSDEPVDLIAEKTDIAIRTGVLRDSSLRSRRLLDSPRLIVASPDYLARFGTPQRPEELRQHACLTFGARPHLNTWQFSDPSDGASVHVDILGRLLVNNGESMRLFALAGAGIARLSQFHVSRDLAEGRLIRLLEPWDAGETEPISAIYSAQTHVPQRIRRFLDFLVRAI
ncbi:LysR family transcriptional regulator [Shinella sp. CPCC 101442]|uniref:LysR family transcriptional regulator n=1 Tax=Shinella sp. CPCC 101442 TaxID=2932265 RepID=UPI0021531948|nr:LysR family transcriptional regulator [Shinella sp. CPCC 101442]MCR6503031.1 LysR family transcriptional regulator [Shinella sp. CPCC 101442]